MLGREKRLSLTPAAGANHRPKGQLRPRRLPPDRLFSPKALLPAGLTGASPTASTFLPALCSPGVTPLHRYYGGSDSCPALPAAQVSLLHAHHQLRPFRPQPPAGPSRQLDCSIVQLRESPSGFRLHHDIAGSPIRPAETGSSSCGLAARLRLLPTPPRGDAVTFGYRPEHRPGRDFHLLSVCACRRTISRFQR